MEKIIIYTDGSSRGNPGPGGWGAIIIRGDDRKTFENESEVLEIGGREDMTTNNRMEMIAAIEALRVLPSFENSQGKNIEVEIFSDSEYLIKGITLWIKGWQKNNWRTKDRKEVLNQDLWQKLLEETEKRNVQWKKVLGHSGHKFNDRCDEIATSFADGILPELFDGLKSEYSLFH